MDATSRGSESSWMLREGARCPNGGRCALEVDLVAANAGATTRRALAQAVITGISIIAAAAAANEVGTTDETTVVATTTVTVTATIAGTMNVATIADTTTLAIGVCTTTVTGTTIGVATTTGGDKAAAAATQDTTVVAAAAGMEVDETIGAIVGTMTVTGTTTDGDTTTEAVAAGSEIATTSHRMTLATSHRTAVNACTMRTTFPATLRARRRSASVDSRWRSQRRAN